jgi:PTH2 family peptidyl-tRNA hydrolase
MTTTNIPSVLSIVKPLFKFIEGRYSRIVLFKNRTLILLNDASEDPCNKLIQFSKLEPKMTFTPLQCFRSYNTNMYINPKLDTVGLLCITEKSVSVPDGLTKALGDFKKDFLNREIIFDSSCNSLTDYIPVQYIFVNTDLKMGKGKIAGQVGHSIGIIIEKCITNPDCAYIDWKETLMKKVILKANGTQLLELHTLYGDDACVLIRDAGLTQIPSGSLTVVGFRPMYQKDVPKSFENYKLL